MKKLKTILTWLTILIVLTVISGCTKEDCTCGIIANDGIDNDCYWLEVRNDCTGNKRKFCFDQDVWLDSHVGESFCVIGEVSW